MQQRNLLQIVTDRSFRRLCVPVRCAMRLAHWRERHPGVPFWTLANQLVKLTNIYRLQSDRETQRAYLEALSKLLTAIGDADPRLRVNADDITGYIRLLDEHGGALAGIFLGYSSSTTDYVTPAQVAAFTGDAESTWRNRAARHEIPLAWKAGKQWLLPKDVLLFLYGIEMPADIGESDPEAPVLDEDDDPVMTDEEYHRVRRELNRDLN